MSSRLLPQRHSRSLLLWGAVVLLHAGALWLLQPSLRPAPRTEVMPATVTLRLLAPMPPPMTADAPVPRAASARSRTAAPRRAATAISDERSAASPDVARPPVLAPVTEAPTAEAAQPLDLHDATRAAIRATERLSRGPVQAPQQVAAAPEADTALGREIARATWPDCRDAYAETGLLAIPLMLYEAAGGKGTNCRWR